MQRYHLSSSMHHLSTIKIYNIIVLTLLNYIDTYKLQESLADKTALYPLYYIGDFKNWEEAFQYLLRCSSFIFQLGTRRKQDKSEAVIAAIKSFVQNHLSKSLNLTTIASIVNYNESYTSRLFRQHTGCKLSDYIYAQKIAKAKKLLSTTNEAIMQIAADTGFDSAQYFSLSFKKATGMSPSDYRRMNYMN